MTPAEYNAREIKGGRVGTEKQKASRSADLSPNQQFPIHPRERTKDPNT